MNEKDVENQAERSVFRKKVGDCVEGGLAGEKAEFSFKMG